VSNCPYEARGEACQCYGINGHLSSTQVAEKEALVGFGWGVVFERERGHR
jgi:hypothetical protein